MDLTPPEMDWENSALLPAIVQDAHSGEVRMLGYMNRAALEQTCASGRVTFYSRSRNTLWTKGETSGNWLSAVSVSADCDRDTLLVRAVAAGPTCHTGSRSCFGDSSAADFLATLESVIDQRLSAAPADSYVGSLAAAGVPRMAQKVGEEGVEVALAAGGDVAALVGESADLLFHLLVLLRTRELSLDDVRAELSRRHGAAQKEPTV